MVSGIRAPIRDKTNLFISTTCKIEYVWIVMDISVGMSTKTLYWTVEFGIHIDKIDTHHFDFMRKEGATLHGKWQTMEMRSDSFTTVSMSGTHAVYCQFSEQFLDGKKIRYRLEKKIGLRVLGVYLSTQESQENPQHTIYPVDAPVKSLGDDTPCCWCEIL